MSIEIVKKKQGAFLWANMERVHFGAKIQIGEILETLISGKDSR